MLISKFESWLYQWWLLSLKDASRRILRVLICFSGSAIPGVIYHVIHGPIWRKPDLFIIIAVFFGFWFAFFFSIVWTRAARYAVDLDKANEKLKETSLRDSLTGLYNNRDFMIDLIKMFTSQAKRKNGFLYFLFADIDDMKVINDRYGHVVGDDAIIANADTFKESLREEDYVFRYGGDENIALIYLDEISEVQAEEIIRNTVERIMKNTDNIRIYGSRENSIVSARERVPLTVSVGSHLVKLNNNIKEELETASKKMKEVKEENKRKREIIREII